MSSNLSERAAQIFLGAVELPEEEREAYIERECGGDERLRVEVDRLMRGDRDDQFLGAPLIITEPEAPNRKQESREVPRNNGRSPKKECVGGPYEPSFLSHPNQVTRRKLAFSFPWVLQFSSFGFGGA